MPTKDLPIAEKIRECQDSCGKTYGYAEYIYGLKETVFTVIQRQF